MNSPLLTLLCVYLGASPALGCYCFLPIWNSNQEGGFYPMSEDGRRLACGMWSHNLVETGDDNILEVDGNRHKRDTAGARIEFGGGVKAGYGEDNSIQNVKPDWRKTKGGDHDQKSWLPVGISFKQTGGVKSQSKETSEWKDIHREGEHNMKIKKMPSEHVEKKLNIKFGGFADGGEKVTQAKSKGSSKYNHANGSKEESFHESKSYSNDVDNKNTMVIEKRIAAGINGRSSIGAVKGKLRTDGKHKKSMDIIGAADVRVKGEKKIQAESTNDENAAEGEKGNTLNSKSSSHVGGSAHIYSDSNKRTGWAKGVAIGEKVKNSSGAQRKVGIEAGAFYGADVAIKGGSNASKTGHKGKMGKEHEAESNNKGFHTQEMKSEDVKESVARPVLNQSQDHTLKRTLVMQ